MKRATVLFVASLMPLSLLIILLLVFHVSASNVGFSVWPIGEARNWIAILRDGPGASAAKILWNIDGRNPLSPWWYIAVRPLFYRLPQAFLILQLVMSALLGLSTTALIFEISEYRKPRLALFAGILTSLFIANIHLDGIHWNFVGAMAVTILSIFSYARFAIGTGRRENFWYAVSLVLWLVAIGTYTIQAGAIFAIFLLALTVPGRRLSVAIKDTIPYAWIFVLFILIWRTTDTLGIASVPLHPSVGGALASISQGLWHSSFGLFWGWARKLSILQIVTFGAVPVCGVILGLRLVQESDATEGSDKITTLRMALISVGIGIPTVVLESSGTMWGPGTRWPMIMQFSTPMFALTLLAAITLLIPSLRARKMVLSLGVALLAGCFGIAFAAMNLNQVYLTLTDRHYFAALAEVMKSQEAASPRHYIVRVAAGVSAPSDFVSEAYSKTVFPDAEVGYSNLLPHKNGLPVKLKDGC